LHPPDEWLHVAFTGHRGCGKSTELLRLKRRWERDYFVVYFEVTDLLDPNDIAFTDLFIATAMVVAQAFHDSGMPLSPKRLKSIEEFAATVIHETTDSRKAQIGAGGKAEAGAEIPFVAKLKAWITSQFQAATEQKVTIRRIFERDVTRLITDTNLLLDDARARLRKARRNRSADLLIIIDNLDRLPPEVGERLVFQHSDLLKQLRSNVIYTIPVSVLHSPKGIERAFPQHDILPMVKVHQYGRRKLRLDWDEDGVSELAEAVAARVELQAVFEDVGLVRELARQSGGCLRHLMQFARYACEGAYARKAAKVSAKDIDAALARMQFDFERMIPPEHYPILREVARTKNLANDEFGRAALFNLSVLEYNGENRWTYVHPLVWRIGRFQEEVRGKRKKARQKA